MIPVLFPPQLLELSQISVELFTLRSDLWVEWEVAEPILQLICKLFGVVEDEAVLLFDDEFVDTENKFVYSAQCNQLQL